MDVFIFPCGDYYWEEDYPEGPPSYKSDDYTTLTCPDDVDEPEDWVAEQIMAVNLGSCCEQRSVV